MKLEEMTLDVEQHVEVKADIGDVFKGVRHRFGEGINESTVFDSRSWILASRHQWQPAA